MSLSLHNTHANEKEHEIYVTGHAPAGLLSVFGTHARARSRTRYEPTFGTDRRCRNESRNRLCGHPDRRNHAGNGDRHSRILFPLASARKQTDYGRRLGRRLRPAKTNRRHHRRTADPARLQAALHGDHGTDRRHGRPSGHQAYRSAYRRQRTLVETVRSNLLGQYSRRARIRFRPAHGIYLLELRNFADPDQRAGRPVFADSARQPPRIQLAGSGLRSRTTAGRHGRPGRGDPRRRLGSVRIERNRRRREHHHQGTAPQLGLAGQHDGIHGVGHGRRQYLPQRFHAVGRPPGGSLPVRIGPQPRQLRPQRRRFLGYSEGRLADCRLPRLLQDRSLFQTDFRIPPYQRFPPGRRPPRTAAPRIGYHRAGPPLDQRRRPSIRPLHAEPTPQNRSVRLLSGRAEGKKATTERTKIRTPTAKRPTTRLWRARSIPTGCTSSCSCRPT